MERFEIVDEYDRVIGQRLRSECHGNPDLIHRVAHVLVFNLAGELVLQMFSLAGGTPVSVVILTLARIIFRQLGERCSRSCP